MKTLTKIWKWLEKDMSLDTLEGFAQHMVRCVIIFLILVGVVGLLHLIAAYL